MKRFYLPNLTTSAAVLGMAVLMFLALGFYPAVSWTRDHALTLSLFIGAFLIGSLVTQLLWKFSRRNRTIFHWIWTGACGCAWVAILLVAREAQFRADQSWVSMLQETRAAFRERGAREAAAALAEFDARTRRQLQDRFAQYDGRVDAAALQQIRDLDAAMEEELNRQFDDYRQIIRDHGLRGPDAWLRAATREELETERQAYQAHLDACRRLLDFLERFAEIYEEKIAEHQFSPAADRIAKAELQRLLLYFQVARIRDLRELEARLFHVSLETINLLRRNWGRWQWNPREGSFLFDSEHLEFEVFQNLEGIQMLLRELDNLDPEPEPESPSPLP